MGVTDWLQSGPLEQRSLVFSLPILSFDCEWIGSILGWGRSTRLHHLFEELDSGLCHGFVLGRRHVGQSTVVTKVARKGVPMHIRHHFPLCCVGVAAAYLLRVQVVHLVLHD